MIRVADPKLLFPDPDSTWLVISDSDLDPDPDPDPDSDPDPRSFWIKILVGSNHRSFSDPVLYCIF